MIYAGVCIGGPLDGQFRATNAPRFEAATPVAEAAFVSLDDPPVPHSVSIATYQLDALAVGDGRAHLTFWRPTDQTKRDSLVKLFKGYRAVHPRA